MENKEKDRPANTFGESVDQLNPEYTYNGLQGNNSGVSGASGGNRGGANNNRRAAPKRR